MKIPRPWIVLVIVGAGFSCGMIGKKLAQTNVRSADSSAPVARLRSPAADVRENPAFVETTSRVTVESLFALPARERYRRLALWLLDAGETDISRFLESDISSAGPDYEMVFLALVFWTRLNAESGPDSAIIQDRSSVAGAWACHDPEAALAADLARGSPFTDAVARAIGEFQADWMFAHFQQIPKECQAAALEGFCRRPFKRADCRKIMKLADRWNDPSAVSEMFYTVTRKFPEEAWNWYQDNKIEHPEFQSESKMLETLMHDAPPRSSAAFEMIAASLPPGASRRALESKAMELLAKSDPEAVVAKARLADAPATKAEYLAIAGKQLVYAEPQRAFEIADELLAAFPQIFDRETRLPDGSVISSPSERLYLIHPFFNALCVRDPDRMMNSYLAHDPSLQGTETFTTIATIWARHSPESCATWLNQQSDPRIREPAARALIETLSGQERYGEALDWAASLATPDRNPTASLFEKWRRIDPDSAAQWLKDSTLADDVKSKLRKDQQ